MTHNSVSTALKGFLMGAANVVPGVSGGTIALITGIYAEIIEALNSLMVPQTWKALLSGDFRRFWNSIHGSFCLALAIGVIASVFSLAKFMTYALGNFPVQTWAFFFGLILASAAIMFRDIKDWKMRDILLAVAGVITGVVVCTLSPTRTPDEMWFIFICGAIAVCTMILPGISGSFILLLFCKYDYIMDAIARLDIPVLTVFGAGCLVGILAFSKFLHWLLARRERETMLVLLGFIIGSLIKVWPWSNHDAICKAQNLPSGSIYDPHYGAAVLWCLAGIAIGVAIDIAGRKSSDAS